ncbi:MAG: GMC family oxidoreductase [Candidatus Poribacteria bacterium]
MAKHDSYDVVIIGSGFGGSVTALRLAQAGKKVCVLERGKRYAKGSFPRTFEEFTKAFWSETNNGLLDFRLFKDIGVLIGSGVGGGSLIYANVHYRPPENVFNESFPKSIRGRKILDPYYNLVADMLKIRPVPSWKKLPKSLVMEETARRLGKNDDLKALNLAIFFADQANKEGVEVNDPYGRGGPPQSACAYTGWCVAGCNIHAKNTLDLNYLWFAEKRYGAEIVPEKEVFKIQPEKTGGYRVYFKDRSDGSASGSVLGKKVILSAGALGSTEILLRSKNQYGTLPKISDALGLNFSGNGDVLAGVASIEPQLSVEPTKGPTITRSIEFNSERFIMEEAGYPAEFAQLIESSVFSKGVVFSYINSLVKNALFSGNLRNLLKDLFDVDKPAENILAFLVIGEDASDGKIRLKKDEIQDKLTLDIQWENDQSMGLINEIQSSVGQIARKLHGSEFYSPLWSLAEKLITVHPLGGCLMADDSTKGVIDHKGEVYNYPGLYVADGSIMPKSLRMNPSMTIAALSERIAFWMIHGRDLTENDSETPMGK